MFDCIVNAEAPYPRFLSVQGLELIQKVIAGTSPVVQWLRLCTSTAGGAGSIPGPGN